MKPKKQGLFAALNPREAKGLVCELRPGDGIDPREEAKQRRRELPSVTKGNSNPMKTLGSILSLGTALLALGGNLAHAEAVYVSNQGNSTVVGFNATGSLEQVLSNGVNHALGVAFDKDGNLYAANYNDLTIVRFASDGTPSVFVRSGMQALALAFDIGGNLYATDANFDRIVRFTPTGAASVFASVGLNHPVGLAFDSAGRLYAANSGNNSIVRFDSFGTPTIFASAGLDRPRGLAFDLSGNLYVANGGNNTIVRFDSAGTASLFASTGLNSPIGLAFDGSSKLYAVNGDANNIMRFDSSGNASVFADVGLNSPFMIAVIPEPAVSMLFVIAIGLRLVGRRRSWNRVPG